MTLRGRHVRHPGGETRCHEAVLEAITKGCPGAVEWAEGCMKAMGRGPTTAVSSRMGKL